MVLPLGNLVLPLLYTRAIEDHVNQLDSVLNHAQNSIPGPNSRTEIYTR